jgi:very-short-patch-repair endonuclease
MNSFEAEVFDVLSSKGIPLISQCGASGYRIDLVAQHPRQRGRYVLAIECDGASYHSSPTARDRDRLRQQQLVSLGWRLHRIWSTDWFMRKDEEVNRALAAYEDAVRFVDESESSGASPAVSEGACERDGSSAASRARGPRPHVIPIDEITEYSESELMAMISWIESDGRLRSDEEIIEELVPELGFRRRGARIEGVLKSTLQKYRTRPGTLR